MLCNRPAEVELFRFSGLIRVVAQRDEPFSQGMRGSTIRSTRFDMIDVRVCYLCSCGNQSLLHTQIGSRPLNSLQLHQTLYFWSL
jgi:hypothetical protein